MKLLLGGNNKDGTFRLVSQQLSFLKNVTKKKQSLGNFEIVWEYSEMEHQYK